MAHITYTLEYDGKVIANVPGADYSTPTFSGKTEFLDQQLYQQLAKVDEFGWWSEENLPDDISDEDYYAEMEKYGLQREYYDMWHDRSKWLVRGSDGSISQSIVSLDTYGIEWRPDAEVKTHKNSSGFKGFLGRFKR